MMDGKGGGPSFLHSHVFLGEEHQQSERKTWAVIWLCGAMMIAEIAGGLLFGSIALVADGMHMSTHAGALLGQEGHDHDAAHTITAGGRTVVLEVFEDGVPPRFRMRAESGPALAAQAVSIETVRPDGRRQIFTLAERDGYLESAEEIPEPHAFTAHVRIGGQDHRVVFEEHEQIGRASCRERV